MLIDTTNGAIAIGKEQFFINCETKLDNFVNTPLFCEAKSEDVGIYPHYYLKCQKVGEIEFCIRIVFSPNGKIDCLSFALYQEYQNDDFWKHWTKKRELKQKMFAING
jgi:hypothetical protein